MNIDELNALIVSVADSYRKFQFSRQEVEDLDALFSRLRDLQAAIGQPLHEDASAYLHGYQDALLEWLSITPIDGPVTLEDVKLPSDVAHTRFHQKMVRYANKLLSGRSTQNKEASRLRSIPLSTYVIRRDNRGWATPYGK